MIRALLDTNVIVSGIFGFRRQGSTPGRILQAWYEQRFDLVVSDALILEVQRTLGKPFFDRSIPAEDRTLVVAALMEQGQRTHISVSIERVATHPEDDLVLAAAVSARVDYMVTGDKMLLQLGSIRGVPIVDPRDFLDLLDASPKQDD